MVTAAVSVLLLGLSTCSTHGSPPSLEGDGSEGGGTGDPPHMADVTLSVRVMALDNSGPVDPLKLSAGQSVALVVSSKPAVAHNVRFALLGDALDAALSATDVPTNSLSGSGQVVLTAPTEPKAFGVRVTTEDAEPFYLAAAVPSTGAARILLRAQYGGERGVTSWTATAWENTTCADLRGAPPADSDNVVTSSTFPVPLDVQAGVKLAVVLRGGHYVWGCRTVDAAVEGAFPVLDVTLADVPIKLEQSALRFTLELSPKEPLVNALAPLEGALAGALVGGTTDDVKALLDAMQGTLRDASAFRSTRKAEQWDSYLRTALGGGSGALRAVLGRFVEAGLDALDGKAALVGDVVSVPSSTTPAVSLESAFGLSARRASFGVTGASTWDAQADDSVLVGFGLSFDPLALLVEAATHAALTENTFAVDLADAMSEALPCKTVAQTLVDHGESATHSTDGCDLACTQTLCEKGVRVLVGRATDASLGSATLALGLEGTGGIDDAANLTLLNGSWLGELEMPPLEEPAADAAPPSAEPVRLEGNFLATALGADED